MRNTWLACALLILAGCAGLPQHVRKFPSEALVARQTTPLGRIVAQSEDGNARTLSGVRLLTTGEEALDSLIALADHAERTLDIQYYIIRQDESARVLLQHVLAAADRGVRVRVLVDDLNTAGEDRRFMHLSEHANVEVRVFNPFPGGRSAIWSRILSSLSDIPRINHRMHNKLFVADNEIAISGGRNIGDEYFTLDKHSNFIDLDVVAAGPIVPQLSASFDAFWNSKYAYPIATIASPVPLVSPARAATSSPASPASPPSPESPASPASPASPESSASPESPALSASPPSPASATFPPPSASSPSPAPPASRPSPNSSNSPVSSPSPAQTAQSVQTSQTALPELPSASEGASGDDAQWLARELDAHSLELTWVPATVLADRPAKIASDTAPDQEVTISNNIAALMRSAERDIIVISPYFVPGPKGLALMRELIDRGVRIHVLTNSLASTDSPLVHNGYSRYRVALLKMGVELFEVRPRLGQKRPRFHPFRGANASLHAKSLVIDQKTVFIGSLNMDRRSARFNSELGLVMRSPEIARQVTSLFNDISVYGSYRLSLDAANRIVWTSGEGEAKKVWHIDPETTLMQRISLELLAPFAPEDML